MRLSDRSDLLCMPRREWSLSELGSIFRRRGAILMLTVMSVFLLASLYCFVATRRYRAIGQIEVQKDSPGTLGLDRSVVGDAPAIDSDSLDASMTIETNVRILQSDMLAMRVLKDLNLEATEDYFLARRRSVNFLPWIFFWRKPLEPLSVPLESAPNRRYVALKIFARHLKVQSIPGTRLIEVSYASPDPVLSAAIVDHLISNLEEYRFESRFQATAHASQWLGGQLSDLKKQTEDLQRSADRLEQGTGIYGDDTAHNLVLSRLEELSSALSTAESNRILKQSIYEVVKGGDPEMISGLAGNAAGGVSPAMTNSLSLLQTLRGEEAQVQATMDQDSARYGSAYPQMSELHGELDSLQKSIREEIARIGERAHTDYEIAQRAEDAAHKSFEEQKQAANAANDRTVAYELARQEADGSRNLYQGLLGKLKEAGVLEGLRSTNLTVVSPGIVPSTDHPSSPNTPLILVAAIGGGLFFGCVGALVQEATDKSVRSIDELEQVLGGPLLGVVPEAKQSRWFRRGGPPENALSMRRSFALPMSAGASQTILVTSAVEGDGKSRLAASLAVSLAHSGANVLLVDADLLQPSLHTLLGIPQTGGLAEALASGATAAEIHLCPSAPGLSLVQAGNTEAHSIGLLGSRRMDQLVAGWRAQYDFILLDSAPVLPVAEAASLARLCDRTLLVVRYGSTAMQAVQRSYRLVQRNQSGGGAIDVVMNGIPPHSPDYFAYYGDTGAKRGKQARKYA